MIGITAAGFIGEKPQLQIVAANKQKVEFDVIWGRPSYSHGERKTTWERATFVQWGDDAERIASTLDKGSAVTCMGIQETSEWVDKATGEKRSKTKYQLTAWIKEYSSKQSELCHAISVTSAGFVGDNPRLTVVGSTQKVEFDVVWGRRAYSAGEWRTAWERTTMVEWGDVAGNIAASLQKGDSVFCTGIQETSEWSDKVSGKRRHKVTFQLTAWMKKSRPTSTDSNAAAPRYEQRLPRNDSDSGDSQRRPVQRPVQPHTDGAAWSNARSGIAGDGLQDTPHDRFESYHFDGHEHVPLDAEYDESGFIKM